MPDLIRGAEAYLAFAIVLVVVCVAWMWLRYAQRPYAWPAALAVTTSWALGLYSTAALPYDVTISSVEDSSRVQRMWYGVYWATFVLAWVVNPVLGTALGR